MEETHLEKEKQRDGERGREEEKEEEIERRPCVHTSGFD